jgi:hypothetical protein
MTLFGSNDKSDAWIPINLEVKYYASNQEH